jgi:putative peptide zinc metalloprotease protein
MNGDNPLHSTQWHRVASLHPRLQPGTRIQRQVIRGEEWFVFTHPVSGRHYRLNRKAYMFAGRMDGEHAVDMLWNGLQAALGDDAPTQDEVIALLVKLMDSGLVLYDVLPDWPLLQEVQETRRRRERRASLNPFAFRLRLFNPSALLRRFPLLPRLLFHPATALIWTVLVGWALLLAVVDWNAIRAYAAVHLSNPRTILLAWAIYPLMKAAHELAHAFAVRRWGGEVREMGIGFFMLVPAPYVDASASIAFPGKWQRAAVSGAGIAAELALAAMALFVWMAAENGIVREIAFVAMAVGSLSTLLFNGNPLLRFDGYYIFCDLLELPNLATRSQRWWDCLIRRMIAGSDAGAAVQSRSGERIALMTYAPASWSYRMFVSVVIVQWIAQKSPMAAILALLWLGYLLLAQPAWRMFSTVWMPARLHAGRGWMPLKAGGGIVAIGMLLFLLPVPSSTVVDGIVWLPEQSLVRTASTGKVANILARNGEHVVRGQALVMMEEPVLLSKKAQLEAQLRAEQAQQVSGWLDAPQKGSDASENVQRLRRDLTELNAELAKLTLRAEADGILVLPYPDRLLGRHLAKGALVAHVLANSAVTVRSIVPQDDIGRIRQDGHAISVRLAEAGNRNYEGRLIRIEPAATHTLPGAALGMKGGGNLLTHPSDPEGLELFEPVFLLDVMIPEYRLQRAGGRAWVRIRHESKPLAQMLVWEIRQLFLRLFAADKS